MWDVQIEIEPDLPGLDGLSIQGTAPVRSQQIHAEVKLGSKMDVESKFSAWFQTQCNNVPTTPTDCQPSLLQAVSGLGTRLGLDWEVF